MKARRAPALGGSWIRRLSEAPISAKLCIAPGLILCVFLALAGFSYRNLVDSQHRVRDLGEGAFETFRSVSAADDRVETFHTELLRTLSLAATESDATHVAATVASARQAKTQMLADFERLARRLDTEMPAFAKLRTELEVYSATRNITAQ